MAKVVFLMGRPGSGKSTAARHINMLARDKQYNFRHINDYTFLLEMFHADCMRPEKERQFASTQFGGFDVLDFTVLDDVLRCVEQEALKEQRDENKVVLLEFARGDYREVFAQFNLQFLRNAYFLFFEVNVDICITRVNERALYPASEDDHFISEEMLRSYYSTENKFYMQKIFSVEYGVDPFRIKVIDNMGDWKEFGNNVKSFMDTIWLNEEEKLVVPLPSLSTLQPPVPPSKVDATQQRKTEPLDPVKVALIPSLQSQQYNTVLAS